MICQEHAQILATKFALQEFFDHPDFIYFGEGCLGGLLGERGSYAAGHQVVQDAGFSEAVVFASPCREGFGETFVVQIAGVLQATQNVLDVGKIRRAAFQFFAQLGGGLGAAGEGSGGVGEQAVEIQRFGGFARHNKRFVLQSTTGGETLCAGP